MPITRAERGPDPAAAEASLREIPLLVCARMVLMKSNNETRISQMYFMILLPYSSFDSSRSQQSLIFFTRVMSQYTP
ncbi:MAG: hypothetical protein QGH49_14890 [SAR324 cluster bacterium]|nr:hypothetical protein [SAR324 cluster bacterium]